LHTIEDPTNQIDRLVVESPDLLGHECDSCLRILSFKHFRKDSSRKDGHCGQCMECESQPLMSLNEHMARLKERNFNSEGTKRQRWDDQEELKDDESRRGRPMRHSDFFAVLQKLVPNLYVTDGRIQGHLAVFRTYPSPQLRLEGRDFEYLFYCPTGILPEFSQYQFDEKMDVPIRESQRGWRTVLLRLIKAGLLSEETCEKVFGRATECVASNRWFRELQKHRSRK
jgi:hypothetical protein